jgi:hypothetical protein
MPNKIILTMFLLVNSIKVIPSECLQIDYKIINNSKTKSHKTYTENHLFHALQLLLIHKNDGYISYDFEGIQICVWEKYYSLPTTIHPIYSIKLEKLVNNASNTKDFDKDKDSTISHLNNAKIDQALKGCDMPEIVSKVKDMLLREKFGMIQVQKSNVTTIV